MADTYTCPVDVAKALRGLYAGFRYVPEREAEIEARTRDIVAAEVRREVGAAVDKEVGHMQEVVYRALIDGVKDLIADANLSQIDGGASDGDEFEFTETEVNIAIGMLGEELIRVRTLLGNAEAEIAAARRLLANDYMPWESAGGPNDCPHGRSVPCPECDRVVVGVSR